MIVSHQHKFIFLHLGRTGGRSLTAALAKHCGPDDIVTKVRGQADATDFVVPPQNAEGLTRHSSAAEIRRIVGEAVWQEYFVFTFERNPWDKILSRYWAYASTRSSAWYKELYTRLTGHRLSFPAWFRLQALRGRLSFGHYHFPQHYDCYTANDTVCVDFLGRYESRREHLRLISERLGLEIADDLRIGSERRKDRRPYTECYTPSMRRVVERVYAKDLRLLGYRFGEPPPTDPIIGHKT